MVAVLTVNSIPCTQLSPLLLDMVLRNSRVVFREFRFFLFFVFQCIG